MRDIKLKIDKIITQNITNKYCVEPIGHHELGRHYVFSVKDNYENEYILKLYGRSNRWCTEITALEKLQNFSGFPQIIEYGKSKDGTEWLLLRKIKGEVLDNIWGELTLENKKYIMEEMGKYLGLIHNITTYDYYGPWKECKIESRRFENFIEYRKFSDEKIFNSILEQKLPDEELLKEAYNILVKYYPKIESNSQSRMCHRDFSGRNTIVSKYNSNWSIAGIIDFEHCQPDDVFIDFASVYISMILEQPYLKDNFFTGYRKYMDVPDNFDDKLEYYLLNCGLHICSWTYKRANSYYRKGVELLERILSDIKIM